MKIQILSDVHNEFINNTLSHSRSNSSFEIWEGIIPLTDADLIVLAGDMDVGTKGVEWAVNESVTLDKPIIYIAGNHEYYNREYYSTLKQMREIAADTNVHFLENDEIQIGEIRILDATLWTDYNVVPDLDAHQVMKECASALNDHRLIRISPDGDFTPSHAKKIHTESVKWLKSKLNQKTEAKSTVVVTHHGPSSVCQHKKYPISSISGAFHSDLNELVSNADCWIYGHTHSNLDTIVNGCRVISNQPGYPNEIVPDFNSIKVVEV